MTHLFVQLPSTDRPRVTDMIGRYRVSLTRIDFASSVEGRLNSRVFLLYFNLADLINPYRLKKTSPTVTLRTNESRIERSEFFLGVHRENSAESQCEPGFSSLFETAGQQLYRV